MKTKQNQKGISGFMECGDTDNDALHIMRITQHAREKSES